MEKTREQLHQEDLQRIRGFRLLDDDFMTACFNDSPECTELVLQIIMGKSDLRVKSSVVQRELKNLQGHSLRLDVDAIDSNNVEYDIEIQRADNGAKPKRARYHSAILDANSLRANEDFDKLPESYVIFITENDIYSKGLPFYTVNRRIDELDGELFDDGEHILYVNGAYEGETDLGKLMHDFRCIDPADMNFQTLADRARYFKESEEGVQNMCKVIEDMRNEVAVETARETKIEAIKNVMEGLQYSVKQAMDLLKIPEAEQEYYLSKV